jgi:hypothetical protein
MIVVNGDVSCISLEENLFRFLQVLEWCQKHKCLLAKNKIVLSITKCGVIVEHDEHLDLELEICDVYNFKAVCRSCGKKAKSVYEDED